MGVAIRLGGLHVLQCPDLRYVIREILNIILHECDWRALRMDTDIREILGIITQRLSKRASILGQRVSLTAA